MANTLTVKTGYSKGVTLRSGGFTPVVTRYFKTTLDGIAANAQIAALALPTGSILRHLIVDVKKPGAGTLAVGKHTGGLNDPAANTVTNTYSASTPIDLTAVGKTLYSPAAALTAADTYVVVTPNAAQAVAEFEVTAIVDVFDVSAYAE